MWEVLRSKEEPETPFQDLENVLAMWFKQNTASTAVISGS
jgi:hypothetical protein